MATKRIEVGSVIKSKEAGRPDYIKFSQDVVFKKGDTLSLDSQKSAIESLQGAIDSGKVSGDWVQKRMDDLQTKWPEFVRFRIFKISKEA